VTRSKLIKAVLRFLISIKNQYTADDDAAEGATSYPRGQPYRDGRDIDARDTRGPSRSKLTKEQKKAQRGANKGRKFGKIKDELDLCWKVANGSVCEFGEGYVKFTLLYICRHPLKVLLSDVASPMTSLRILQQKHRIYTFLRYLDSPIPLLSRPTLLH